MSVYSNNIYSVLSPDFVEWIDHAKEKHLDDKRNPFDISNIQLYNPIYSLFYSLTPENYNTITWPNHFQICGENQVYDISNHTVHSIPVFIKYSPLLDPMRYLIGKYDYTDPKLRILPNLENTNDCHSKLTHTNNVSYIDAFMCYLSNQLLTKHGMVHGLEYYGSYLGIQKHFKYNATDDIDYLFQSDDFVRHLGTEFTMDIDDPSQIKCGSRGCKQKIHVLGDDEVQTHSPLNITLGVLDDVDGEILQENTNNDTVSINSVDSLLQLETIGNTATTSSNIDTDIDDIYLKCNNEMVECDSVLNYTDTSPDIDKNDLDDLDLEMDDVFDEDIDDEDIDDEDDTLSQFSDEEQIYVYIKDYPTQMICLGKCDGTLDKLFMLGEVNEKNASAWLFQIIMTLLIYQKAFQFTHNDLHTNNIMYVETTSKYIDYSYEGVNYRVPTYGKIFKIIDFGRAIYKYNGITFCSDSYAVGGDAYTQYNCEPFFNPNAKRIDPNLSFDLCRLACSIYFFILDHNTPLEKMNAFQQTIHRWCLDDNGKNVLFKKNGEERYPDFKLYKMIARHVHHHTPENQLKYDYFNQYALSPNSKLPKSWMKVGFAV